MDDPELVSDSEVKVRPGSIAFPVFAGFLGILEATHVMLRSGFRAIHTDPGDARHLNYILEHIFRWVLRDPIHRSLWDLPFFFPVENTGAYSEMLIGLAPFYVPWRIMGLGPDTSLQALTMTLLALNFGAAFVFLRRGFGFDRVSASAGSFLFSFGAPRVLTLGHVHLLPQFFILGVLISLIELFRGPDMASSPRARRWIAIGFACLVAQFYTCFYLAWFLTLGMGVALAISLANRRYRLPLIAVTRGNLFWIGCCGLLGAAALWPLIEHYRAAASAVGVRTYDDVAPFLPPLKAWLNPGPYSWLYSWQGRLPVFSSLPYEWVKRFFLGFVTMGASIYGLFLIRRRSVTLVLLTMGLLLALATSWPGSHSLWHVVYLAIPGAKAIRAVPRLLLFVLIPVSVGFAATTERVIKMRRRSVLGVLFLAVALEQGQTLPSYDKLKTRREVEALAAEIPRTCRAFYYSPIGQTKFVWESQLDGMWAGMITGVPTINGYSSNLAPGWLELYNHSETKKDDPRLRTALDTWCRAHSLDRAAVCWVQVPAPR